VPAEAVALDRSLRADLTTGGDSGTLVVVQGRDVEHTLQQAEAAAQTLEGLVAQGVIGGFDSVTRLLPSLATQERRRAALPEPGTLRAALAEAAGQARCRPRGSSPSSPPWCGAQCPRRSRRSRPPPDLWRPWSMPC
jgi:predicted exporter